MKRAALLILIASALLLSSIPQSQISNAQGRSDQAKKHESRTGGNNPDGRPIASLAEHAHAEPASSQTAKKADQHAHDTAPILTHISQWAQIATAVLLVIFTGGLLWTSYKQWRAMEKSLQVSQRAYVNVKGIDWIEKKSRDDLLFSPIDFVIRNSGRTPAKNLLVQVGGEISKDRFGKGTPTDLDDIRRTPLSRHGVATGH
jgi:ABC-type nickel/cobalt efflux system permease component RcnA